MASYVKKDGKEVLVEATKPREPKPAPNAAKKAAETTNPKTEAPKKGAD